MRPRIDGDGACRAGVADGGARPRDLPVDLEVEPPRIVLGDESLDDRDRAPTARRVVVRRRSLPGQMPRHAATAELRLDGVLVSARPERRRLAATGRIGREEVLARRRLDRRPVRVVVTEVREETAARGRLDALEERRDRIRGRRRQRLAVVLPDRLVLGRPVLAGVHLCLPFIVDVRVRRNDVVAMVEVAAVEVAVVRDRRRVCEYGLFSELVAWQMSTFFSLSVAIARAPIVTAGKAASTQTRTAAAKRPARRGRPLRGDGVTTRPRYSNDSQAAIPRSERQSAPGGATPAGGCVRTS